MDIFSITQMPKGYDRANEQALLYAIESLSGKLYTLTAEELRLIAVFADGLSGLVIELSKALQRVSDEVYGISYEVKAMDMLSADEATAPSKQKPGKLRPNYRQKPNYSQPEPYRRRPTARSTVRNKPSTSRR